MTPLERAAIALANYDARQVDAPEIQNIEDFRMDADRRDYMGRARAAMAAISDALDESSLVESARQMAEMEGSEAATKASLIYDEVIDWFDAALAED